MHSRVQNVSRRVEPGDTFVAVRGASADGSRFIADAIQAGAAEIVSELPRPADGVPAAATTVQALVAARAVAAGRRACRHLTLPESARRRPACAPR